MGHPGPPYREGGPFSTWKYFQGRWTVANTGYYQAPGYPSTWYRGSFVCRYDPAFSPAVVPSTMGLTSQVSHGDPMPYGARGWEQYAPGRAVADLSVMLAEIRDVPRTLQQTARGFHEMWKDLRRALGPKKAANHWLNTQFGWLPFVSDVRKLVHAYKTAERSYDLVKRNNGKATKRGGVVVDSCSTSNAGGSTTVHSHYPGLDIYFYPNYPTMGSHVITDEIQNHVWFEGKFRYWIPNINSVVWKRNYLRQLYGLSVTPSVLWEVTPWSWLIDWFSNVGSVINNLDSGWAENLAATYAFIMCRKRTMRTISSTMCISPTITASWSYYLETKRRASADPFGFGLTWDQFSPRQLSILAALGISRT